MKMIRAEGHTIGRFKVRKLMKEAGIASKQPGAHKSKLAAHECPDISNILNWQFNVDQPNEVWCGDITYIWSGSKWCYLAVVFGFIYPMRGGMGRRCSSRYSCIRQCL